MRCVGSRRWRRSRRGSWARELQPEVFRRYAGALTEVFDRLSRKSIAFAHQRQVDELQSSATFTSQVHEAGPQLGNSNDVFCIAVVSSTSNEFSQRGHLGECRSHVLSGSAGSGDSNLGRCNDDAVRLQYTELEHRGGKPQPRLPEHCPILFRRALEIVEGPLIVTQSNRYVSHDEQLESPGQLLQRLRLYHKVILQAPSA
jgi:hypothetical protein